MIGVTNKLKFTKGAIEKILAPSSGQYFYWDTEVRGFGLRVSVSGSKSFIYQTRVNGKERRITIGRFGSITVEQARDQARKHAAQVASGIDPVAEKQKAGRKGITLAQATEAYLTGRNLKDSTRKDVERAMKGFSDWSKKALVDIKPNMIEARHKELSEASPTRANLAMRYLRAVVNYANAKYSGDEGEPLLSSNPVKRLSVIKSWNRVSRRRSFVKPHQMKAWFDAVNTGLTALKFGAELRDCFLLSMLTGVRPSEALQLQWKGVDFKHRTLTFFDTKNHSDHELPLTDWLKELLEARKAIAGPEYVFSTADGTRLKDTRTGIAKVIEISGVEFMPTDLRRSFITAAERLDIGPYTLKRMLNHTISNDVTAGYIVPTTDRLREPMQQIEDVLLRDAGVKEVEAQA